MRGRFPVVLWLCVHVCHVAGGGYVWGWRVLSDDGSWRNHVWAESGRGVGEEEIKKEAKERKRGAFTQQTGLPSPSSYPCIHPPTVGDIDPGGAVNSSGVESVCCEGSQRPTPWYCRLCGSATTLELLHCLSQPFLSSLSCHMYGSDTNTCSSLQPFSAFLSADIFWHTMRVLNVHWERHISLLSAITDGLLCLEDRGGFFLL